MGEGWVRDVAEAFWLRAGQPGRFPRNLELAVAWATPLAVLKIPNLWIVDVATYFRKRQLPFSVDIENRPLHGCVCVYAEKGIIIVDGTDTPSELRFTLAHELAHFLRDYSEPRRRALQKLGPAIRPVLDGIRSPTTAERVDSILADAPIGIFAHFMHRDPRGEIGSEIIQAETEADRLALELIAPEHEVRGRLSHRLHTVAFQARIAFVQRLLVRRFGLPRSVAEEYAKRLCRQWFGGPSVREWLAIP